MHFERNPRHSRSVNLTPLIDVVFLLLIFFMLSTSFVRTESMELSMPQFKAEMQADGASVPVYIAPGGQLFVAKTAVDHEGLRELLIQYLERNPEMPVLLMTGPSVTVQQMVRAMDTIYVSGGKNVSVTNWNPKAQPQK